MTFFFRSQSLSQKLNFHIHIKKKMEAALWNVEDKWKLTTQEALALLSCTALAVVGLGVATLLKRWRRRKTDPPQVEADGAEPERLRSCSCGCGGPVEVMLKRALMSSLRWSQASKWGEQPLPLLVMDDGRGRWHSHNSESPVWQRPILMGEKCELPRFSGLILYDERGRPRHDHHQVKPTPIGRTTLKDLL